MGFVVFLWGACLCAEYSRKEWGTYMQKLRKQVTKHKDRTIREVKSSRCGRLTIGALAMLLLWAGAGNVAYAGTAIHHHSGDEENGGDCYQTPVYHTHDGSTEEGGDCYQTPVYHVHTGDEVNGGGCYGEEVYHTHEGTAQTGGACYTPVYHSHTSGCYREGSHSSDCSYHIVYHSYDCGTVHDWNGDGHGCDGFYEYECGGHRYLACGQGGQIVGYTFSCTEEEDTLTGYALNCDKTEEDVDSYELTCEKTDEDIDYYDKTCGMEEGEEYYVPDPEPDNGGNDSGNAGASSNDGSQDDGAEPEPTIVPTPEPTLEPTPEPTPEAVTAAATVSTPEPVKATAKPSAEKTELTPSPVMTPTPTAAKRVVSEVKVSPVKAQPVDTATEPVVIKKTNPLLTPAGKIISITSGSVVLVILVGWLLFYLRRSVRVYNDNGKGHMHYLGRAAVEQTEEGYCIRLTDKLVERAVTNRYSIRPDLFLIGKNSSWEVFIVKDGKKKAVYLEKEIRITI